MTTQRLYFRNLAAPSAVPFGKISTIWPGGNDFYYPAYAANSGAGFEDRWMTPTISPNLASSITIGVDVTTESDAYIARFISSPLAADATVGTGEIKCALGLISSIQVDDQSDPLLISPNNYAFGGAISVWIYRPAGNQNVGFCWDGDNGNTDPTQAHEYFMFYFDTTGTGLWPNPANATGLVRWVDGTGGLWKNTAPFDPTPEYLGGTGVTHPIQARIGDMIVCEIWLHTHYGNNPVNGNWELWYDSYGAVEEGLQGSQVASFLEIDISPAIPDIDNPFVTVLSETEIAKEISLLPPRNDPSLKWFVDPTYTNTSYASCICIDPGGITHPVNRVDVTGRPYSRATSLLNCDNTDDTWYHDERLGTLWINFNSLLPPTAIPTDLNAEIVMAWWTYGLSTSPVEFNGHWYEPRIMSDPANFETSLGMNDEFFGDQPISSGSLVLANGDGWFDQFAFDYEWRTSKTRILYSRVAGASYSQFAVFRECLAGSVVRNDSTFSLKFKNMAFKMKVPILQYYLTSVNDPEYPEIVDYPDLDDEVEGKFQSLFFGEIDGVTGSDRKIWRRAIPLDNVANPDNPTNKKFIFIANLFDRETGNTYGTSNPYTLILVDHASYGGVVTYSLDNTVIELAGAIGNNDKVRVAAIGYVDDLLGSFTGTASLKITKPWDVIHFLLKLVAGYKNGEIDIAAFTAVGVTKQGIAGTFVPPVWAEDVQMFIDDPPQKEKPDDVFLVIQRLAAGLKAIVQEGNDGRITMTSLDALPQNTDAFVDDSDILAFEEEWGMDNIVSQVTVNLIENPTTKKKRKRLSKRKKKMGTVTVNDRYAEALFNIKKEVVIDTYLTTEANAKLLANSYLDSFKRGAILLKFSDLSASTINVVPGARFLLNRRRAIGPGGKAMDKVYWMMQQTRNYRDGIVQVNKAMEAFTD